MKYLVVGSGGREHAITWRLLHDGSAHEVYVAPGNGGINDKYRVNIAVNDFESLYQFCIKKNIDMVIVGPEAPLVDGIVDFFNERKIPVFGPTRNAAMLEGSKLYAKKIMEKYSIPTAQHWNFLGKKLLLEHIESISTYPIVIKLDGLAAGKGVAIPENRHEAIDFILQNVQDTTKVFIEEYLVGEEASILGISDGECIIPLIAAQDHKRIFDGDNGPNTGGMGAYAPAPVVTPELLERIKKTVLQPTIDGMRKEGIPFKGILYAGIMITGETIKVLEYNVRFGDPETQVILPLIEGKLGDYFENAVNGSLGGMTMTFKKDHALCVVMSAGGYPGEYEKGKEIRGLTSIDKDIIVFHAGTKYENGKFITNGGRVLNITAIGHTLQEAKDKIYSNISSITFDGAFYRKDIGYRAL